MSSTPDTRIASFDTPQPNTANNAPTQLNTSGVIQELEPDVSSLISTQFNPADYRDRFTISVDSDHYHSVDDVVTDWFTKQPMWLRALSTNSFSRAKVEQAISKKPFKVGDRIGSWEIVDRNGNEIVFGDDMGFMTYRFSFRLIDQGATQVEGATSVKFLWRRSGRFYFGLVRPFHRRFVKLALRITTSQ